MNIDLRELYDTNEDFKRYVNKCRKADGRSVEEELELKIVQEVADYYIERNENTPK